MSVQKIKAYLQEYSYLRSIQSLMYWDMETMMPSGAVEDRAKRLSYVQGKLHQHITAPQYENLLKDLEGAKLNKIEKKLAQELRWDYELSKALPEKHVTELAHIQAIASHAWQDARKKNDWKSFEPHLTKLIELKKKETKYYGDKVPYDSLLKLHDKEFDSKAVTKIFGELRNGLLELIPKVKKDGSFVKVKDLKGPFDIQAQKDLSAKITGLFGLSQDNSRLDVSTHPFSINISPLDQRITTRYVTKNIDSLSSTMHEVGHALYEAGLPREWEGTPLAEAVSLSVHESQSRFWENIVGRSEAFSKYLHPHMKKHFPAAMKGVDVDQLFHVFNRSVPNLIRVESCELYYNLHVIVRFEIEQKIFNEGLKTKDIPGMWNELYEKYLGLRPKNFAEGVLQDSHWAGGAFGYFPTYALGNLISGSLYQKMKAELPGFEKDIKSGKFNRILEFLRANIHSKGRSITSKDIVGELDVKDYLAYLTEKFGV